MGTVSDTHTALEVQRAYLSQSQDCTIDLYSAPVGFQCSVGNTFHVLTPDLYLVLPMASIGWCEAADHNFL